MGEPIELTVNGRRITVANGSTVASALLNANRLGFRTSVRGELRAPLCGMGVCYECRVTIDDVPHQRACMTRAQTGMRVVTTGDRE